MESAAKKERLWSRSFILIIATTLATGICMRMLDSNLAPFAAATWSSKSLGGYLTTTFNIGSITTAFFAGRIVDIKGRRRCLIFGASLFALCTLICSFFLTPAVTLTARFVQGIAMGIVNVSSAAIVSDVIPRSRMGEGMGLYGLGYTITSAFGPMLALAITANGNYRIMFVLCAVIYALVVPIALGINYEKKPEYKDQRILRQQAAQQSADTQYKGLWKFIEKKALLSSVNYAVFFCSNACVLIFLTVYAQEILELNSTQIGLFFTADAITMLLVRLFAGKLMDKYGALCTLIPGHLCNLAMLLILAYFAKGSYALFLLCGALYGTGNALVGPTLQAVGVVDSPVQRNATANSTYAFLMDFGPLVASSVFGPVIDAAVTPLAGYRSMFLASIGICLFSLMMSVVFLNNKARARRRARP